jgi:hypothetical protein
VFDTWAPEQVRSLFTHTPSPLVPMRDKSPKAPPTEGFEQMGGGGSDIYGQSNKVEGPLSAMSMISLLSDPAATDLRNHQFYD